MSDDVKSYTREQLDALNLTALVNTLIDTAKEETRDLLRMGSPTRAIRDARADAEFRLHGVLAMLRATARAGLADIERMQWTVTQLRTALENWGRHHDWCKGPGPLQCNCGYRAALETGYEVSAGFVARDPDSVTKRSGSVSETKEAPNA